MLASAGFTFRLDSHIQVQVLMPRDQLIWCLHTLLISSMNKFLRYLKLMLYKYTNHVGMLLYFTITSWIVPPCNHSCTLYCTKSIEWKKGQCTSWFHEHCKSLLTSSLFCAWVKLRNLCCKDVWDFPGQNHDFSRTDLDASRWLSRHVPISSSGSSSSVLPCKIWFLGHTCEYFVPSSDFSSTKYSKQKAT